MAPEVFCPSCGLVSAPDARFCSGCGRSLGAAPPGFPNVGGGTTDAIPYGYPPAFPPPVGPTRIDQARDRTRLGLLFLIIGLALGWIPYIGALGGILSIIGLILVFMGREGFGPAHRWFVVLGAALFVIAFLITIIGSVVIVFSIVGEFADTTLSNAQIGSAVQNAVLGIFVLALVAAILSGLAHVFVVFDLGDDRNRIVLWVGFVASITISVAIFAIVYPQLSNAISQATSGSTLNSTPITNLENESTLLGLLQGIPALLFLVAYYRAWLDTGRSTVEPRVGSGLPPPAAT
ncbi:MAG: zinc ribbon domain-containing protein [Thermoplasmata archaeon]